LARERLEETPFHGRQLGPAAIHQEQVRPGRTGRGPALGPGRQGGV